MVMNKKENNLFNINMGTFSTLTVLEIILEVWKHLEIKDASISGYYTSCEYTAFDILNIKPFISTVYKVFGICWTAAFTASYPIDHFWNQSSYIQINNISSLRRSKSFNLRIYSVKIRLKRPINLN